MNQPDHKMKLLIYYVIDGSCTIPTEKQIENIDLIPSRQKL